MIMIVSEVTSNCGQHFNFCRSSIFDIFSVLWMPSNPEIPGDFGESKSLRIGTRDIGEPSPESEPMDTV
jgi:hypothetical protein